MRYDVICVGAGIANLMFAHRAKSINPGLDILILDKGRELEQRICPILEHKAEKCVKCKPCAIVNGISGSGAKNDGKYIIPDERSFDYGGWLSTYLPHAKVVNYIWTLDTILSRYADREYPLYRPSAAFKQECLRYDLHLQQANIRHYGSDGNYLVMKALVEDLRAQGVEIVSGFDVGTIDCQEKIVYDADGKRSHSYDKLILGIGRTGSNWLTDFCRDHGIALLNNKVDIGVRVEIPTDICADIAEGIYEPKIYYRTKQYGDLVRTFCWNNGDARVCVENNDGILSVNGYSNSGSGKSTGNSNFALLSSINFTSPFDDPTGYVRYVAALSNMVSGNNVLVQRFGDLIGGRRTNAHRLSQSTTVPTLDTAVAGDISLALPKRILDNIIEMIYALDNVIKGMANYNTLLYSPEIKMYSARPQFMNERFEIIEDVFAAGDGAGVTRSLSQAGAMGMYIADCLFSKDA